MFLSACKAHTSDDYSTCQFGCIIYTPCVCVCIWLSVCSARAHTHTSHTSPHTHARTRAHTHTWIPHKPTHFSTTLLTQTSRTHFWTNTFIQGGASDIQAKGQLCGLGRQLGAVTAGGEFGVGDAKRRLGRGKGGAMSGVGTRASTQTQLCYG